MSNLITTYWGHVLNQTQGYLIKETLSVFWNEERPLLWMIDRLRSYFSNLFSFLCLRFVTAFRLLFMCMHALLSSSSLNTCLKFVYKLSLFTLKKQLPSSRFNLEWRADECCWSSAALLSARSKQKLESSIMPRSFYLRLCSVSVNWMAVVQGWLSVQVNTNIQSQNVYHIWTEYFIPVTFQWFI